MAFGNLLLGMAVLQIVAPSQSLQYQYVNMTKSWTEAQSYCRQNYTDLVTINSEQELSALMNTTALKSGEVAWIGLYNDINSWRWSLSDDRFYTHGERHYRNWRTGEPNNYEGQESCVSTDKTTWNDEPCSNKHTFICFDGNANSYYYSTGQQRLSWYEAQSYCRSHFTDLASVRNLSEQQNLQSLIGSNVAWIGLFRPTWKWSDGSNVSFQNWESGKPNNANGNQNCAVFYNLGRWDDRQCTNAYPFICYSNVTHGATTTNKVTTKRQVIRLVMQSNQNVNDPVVKVAILKSIHQKLKEHGMPESATLKWRVESNGTVFHKTK